jgi:hypothetical protein
VCGPASVQPRVEAAARNRVDADVIRRPCLTALADAPHVNPKDGHHRPLAALARHGSILRSALRDAIDRGELPPGTEVDLLHDVLLGAMRYLMEGPSAPCEWERLERAVSLMLAGASRAP